MDFITDQLIGLFAGRWSLLLNAHFVADQLTRLFVAHASSPATPVTPRPSDSLCSETKWAHFTPLHLVDIASYTRDFSVLGHRQLRRELLSARTLPATPWTPRCSDVANYAGDSSVLRHHQLRQGLLGARTSSATLGTTSVLKHRQLH